MNARTLRALVRVGLLEVLPGAWRRGACAGAAESGGLFGGASVGSGLSFGSHGLGGYPVPRRWEGRVPAGDAAVVTALEPTDRPRAHTGADVAGDPSRDECSRRQVAVDRYEAGSEPSAGCQLVAEDGGGEDWFVPPTPSAAGRTKGPANAGAASLAAACSGWSAT